MSNAAFWLALLDMGQDIGQRARFWNGYLGWKLPPRIKGEGEPYDGWPQLIVDPPDGGWPELADKEKETIETLAEQNGGHPEFGHGYMDFSDHTFCDEVDLSGLILVLANFNKAKFEKEVRFSKKTRFYAQSSFREAVFEEGLDCWKAWFEADVDFTGSRFKKGAWFIGVEFMGGASFTDVVFEERANFNDSRFEERYFSGGIMPLFLVSFRNARFMGWTSFREVLFGNDETAYSRRSWPERRVDFTDTVFMTTTDFRGAVFGGPPAFFNAELHEDTDFSRVDWKRADNDNIRVDYAIRAWERLELIMSKLEKPLDRHRFFRYKMRARRRLDGPLLKVINWLFEKTADYGWGVGRACAWWLGHWVLSAVILFVNAWPSISSANLGKFVLASIGTGFANAHAFLFLAASGGYLEESRKLLASNDAWGLVKGIGVAEAILGPIFLFLVLLTLQKRFRLA